MPICPGCMQPVCSSGPGCSGEVPKGATLAEHETSACHNMQHSQAQHAEQQWLHAIACGMVSLGI
jgi:hypothetical protein